MYVYISWWKFFLAVYVIKILHFKIFQTTIDWIFPFLEGLDIIIIIFFFLDVLVPEQL